MPTTHPSPDYIPARLVEGKTRWYIVYYQVNPRTGLRERFRETYDLNRISSAMERRRKARAIMHELNRKLRYGFPFQDDYAQLPAHTNILKAVEFATEILCETDRKRTQQTAESMCRLFCDFLQQKNWHQMAVGEFSRRHAMAFLDDAIATRKVKPRTWNNYLERTKSIFKVLVEREYVEDNPFSEFKKKRVTGKERRAFSEQERLAVAQEAKKDRWLMLAILLQYHCFIRPVELRRLRFNMIVMEEGVIRLPSAVTKNKENSIVTIPDVLMPYLQGFGLDAWPGTWLVFGYGGEPHRSKPCGHDLLSSRHKAVLEKLQREGVLEDITGLSFYSWKDTGALELFKQKVNMLEIMQQLRHKSLSTTQKYCQSLYQVNREIKALRNDVLTSLL